jgi:hypothetical protein
MRVLAFQAKLDGVVRTIAVREDQTLEQLHETLRLAFGWGDPHLYSFWPGGRFREGVEYAAPFELEESGGDVRSARARLSELGLRKGSTIAYLFDYGDEWQLLLKLVETWPADDGSYPMLVEAEGVPPPQYPKDD